MSNILAFIEVSPAGEIRPASEMLIAGAAKLGTPVAVVAVAPGQGDAVASRLGEDDGVPLREACDRFERQYVLRVLERVQWNVSRAARLLGVQRNTVLAKLSAWNVQRPAEGRWPGAPSSAGGPAR